MPAERLARPDRARLARFLAVGLVNTAFGYGVFAAAILAGLPPEAALLIATVLGVGFNFLTTGRLVFRNRDGARLPRFAAVYAVSYAANALALRALVGAGLPALYAQPLLMPIFIAANIVAMRAVFA